MDEQRDLDREGNDDSADQESVRQDESMVQPQPGENNIAEGKVGGLMGGPNQQQGQGQGG